MVKIDNSTILIAGAAVAGFLLLQNRDLAVTTGEAIGTTAGTAVTSFTGTLGSGFTSFFAEVTNPFGGLSEQTFLQTEEGNDFLQILARRDPVFIPEPQPEFLVSSLVQQVAQTYNIPNITAQSFVQSISAFTTLNNEQAAQSLIFAFEAWPSLTISEATEQIKTLEFSQ